MGPGEAAADIAAHAAVSMRLIEQDFKTPRRTGNTGRHAPATTPRAPVDLGTVDYMARQVQEIVDYTKASAPNAPRPPAEAPDVYRWMGESTAHFQGEQQQTRDAIVYRQVLEHALQMGDESVIRRHPCPDCGCWGLFWRPASQRAACINRHCAGPGQPSHTFTLAQIAHRHIASRETTARRAT
ncbi:hypothetical protein [Streptomyces alfalfae]